MGSYVITEPCIDIKDGSCVEVCPVACIHTTAESRQYYIDPDICIECEQCVIVCPVDAIFVDEEVPEQWRGFIEVNAQFFKELKPPVEPISHSVAVAMIAAVTEYGRSRQVAFSVAVVDTSGEIVASESMDGAPADAAETALASAKKAAGTAARSGGGRPVFDRLEVIGGLGVCGGDNEEDGLAARAGVAAAADALKGG